MTVCITRRFTRVLRDLSWSGAVPIDDSIGLLGRLRVLEPDKPEWTVNLAMVYVHAVRDVFFARDSGNGRRVFTTSMKYGETPRMKHGLETTTDASLMGVTGELLVEHMGLLPPPKADTPEMVNSAGFGKQLLERAHRLEPGNPRWRQ
jgi:hypothetical protein